MNFESSEPSLEKENAEYMETLRAAIEDGKQFGDPNNPDDKTYIESLDRELGDAEADWETL